VSDDFSQPLRGDKFEAEQFDGALLLFYPTEHHVSIPTQHGDTAVVDTHIVALDRPDLTGQPTVLRDARIFGRALVPQLKGAVGGKPVLGRLGRGQNTKGNPPWLLKDFSEQDAQYARQYMTAHADPRTQQTSVPAPSAPPTSNVSAPSVIDTGNPALEGRLVGTPHTQHTPVQRDPQLVALLVAKGVDVAKLPADADLALIVQTLG
jgi:hypothetical protein